MDTSAADSKLATARTVLSAAASIAATAMLARSVARDLLPHEIQENFMFNLRKFLRRFSSEVTMVINEIEGFVQNQVFAAAAVYLSNKVSPASQRFRVSKCDRDKNMVVAMERDEELVDLFNGVKFKWVFICRQIESRRFDSNREFRTTESRSFELCFSKKHKDMVLNLYLPHIMRESKSMKREIQTQKIFTVDIENMFHFSPGNIWKSVNLDHPATFETLALEPEMKQRIVKDLDRFVKRRDYYRKVGKAWKRGYLLYGPPGTGKSSLIAAIANYLKFDVYDLELGALRRNSDLRRILVSTANRSILVVEDIDCTIDLQDCRAEQVEVEMMSYRNRGNDEKVTLSGLLNFIDGLWSSCGDERIIVFTTNHKDKLDPALLRPGRMDVHIHMSYCSPSGFRVLATNYLGLKDHPLFQQIEEAIKISQVTPAEVAEQLMRSDDDVDVVLRALIGFLETRRKENDAHKGQGDQVVADGEAQAFKVDENVKNDEYVKKDT